MEATSGVPVIRARIRRPPGSGLARSRLDRALEQLWSHRLALVVAPAGSGKTTLLAQFAARAGAPVAWYQADGGAGAEEALVSHLEEAMAPVLGSSSGERRWATIDDVVGALERWPGRRALLVVDDLHALEGTPAEGALERLVEDGPPSLHVLAGARRPPQFNLSQLRVHGHLVELSPDDLRFRSWEVEQLFRDVYAEPLPPEALAELTRRTAGWAAGLQLFHLSTIGKSPIERRQAVTAITRGSRLVREYLTRNVLDELPAVLRDFLVGTAPLPRLTARLCDELLGRTGSGALLEEVEGRQLFVSATGDGAYRCHDVLRGHLEELLVQREGEPATRAAYRRAGALLEAEGALHDALAAYARAEDWEAAGRLLGGSGERVIEGPGAWVDALPRTLVEADPWLLLASARARVAAGRLDEALAGYEAVGAAASSPSSPAADAARRERAAIVPWTAPGRRASDDWVGVLLQATRRDPAQEASRAGNLPGATGALTQGLALLLAGHLPAAAEALERSATTAGAAGPVVAGAALAAALVGMVSGDGSGATAVEQAVADADRLGLPWLARVGRACLALTGRPRDRGAEATARRECLDAGDEWGAAIIGLLDSAGSLGRPGTGELVEEVVAAFRRLGAGSLEAWARSAAAMHAVVVDDPEAGEAARSAEAFARTAGVHGARAQAFLCLAALSMGDTAADHRRLAADAADQAGVSLASVVSRLPARLAAAGVGPRRDDLVGRERELAELRSAVDGARSGVGRLVVVVGEPGVGKTRLAEAAAAHAGATGVPVRWGRCSAGAPELWPWLQVLGAAAPAGSSDADPHRRAEVTRALWDVAARAPLLVVLDDLERADLASVALLRFLAPQLRASSLCIVATLAPPGQTGAAAAEPLAELVANHRLPLTGLARADIARFAAALGGTAPSDGVVAALEAATAGNPLFVRESVGALLAAGDPAALSAWETGLVALPLPDALRRVVDEWWARLTLPARDLVDLAAVVGRRADVDVLAAATGVGVEALADPVAEAVALQLVELSAGTITFRSGFVHEALVERLAPRRRAALHRAALNAIEEAVVPPSHPADLARHALEAARLGDREPAVRHGLTLAAAALAVGSSEASWSAAEAVLDVLPAGTDADADRATLQCAAGRALDRLGDGSGAMGCFSAAVTAAQSASRPDLLAEAAIGWSEVYGYTGDTDEDLVDLLQEARVRLEGDRALDALRARVLARLASSVHWLERAEERHALAEEALALARSTGDARAVAAGLEAWQWTQVGPGCVRVRLAAAEEQVALAREAGDHMLELWGRRALVHGLLEVGDVSAADAAIEGHARLADRLSWPLPQGFTAVLRGMQGLLQGRFGEAEEHIGEAYSRGERAGDRGAVQLFALQLFWLYRDQGRLGELEAELRAQVAATPWITGWRTALAMVAFEGGRTDEARSELEHLIAGPYASAPPDPQWHWLSGACVLAEVCAGLGEAEAARHLERQLLPWAGEHVVSGLATVYLGPLSYHLGLLAAARSEWGLALERYADALSQQTRSGARALVARTRLMTATVLLARDGEGDREQAEVHLDAVARTAGELGMPLLVAAAEALGGPATRPAAAVAPDPGERPPPVALRCFGRFELALDGRTVDLAAVRPRAREALRLLASRGGRVVHREVLVDALWPDADPSSALRSLQVAMSSLRQLLEPGVARGAASLLVRAGEGYQLNLPPGCEVDLVAFDRAVAAARSARAVGDDGAAVAHLELALDHYAGDLLPEDGPAEWVVKERERYRSEATDAALALAELHLEAGDTPAAAAVAERGLQVDRYRDALWRILMNALVRAGDHAAAVRARRQYDTLLAELGLPPSRSAGDEGASADRNQA